MTSPNSAGNRSPTTDFIGRQRELAVLTAALDDAMSGRGQMVMLAGEPGIGKTRLAQELAIRAESLGAQVFWGWCYEHAGAPPYWPYVQPIRAYVEKADAQQLSSQIGPGGAEIAEIVPELRAKLPDLGQPLAAEPEQARFRLFDSVATFIKNVSQHQPLILVLEDLHWADESSLLLLEFLAREIAANPLLILGTYRDVEVTGHHPLSGTLGNLVREGNFRRIRMGGLTQQEVGDFVESGSSVALTSDVLETIHSRTGGNPLFVNEVLKLIDPENITDNLVWAETIPDGVRDAIRRRLSRLSQTCNRVLVAASVIGREFDFALLRRLDSGIGVDEVLTALDEALESKVIEALPSAMGQYRFGHALIQQALYSGMSSTSRVRAHAATAETLEELYQGHLEEHAAELVHHFAEAEVVLGSGKLARYSLMAGERALATYAYEEAMQYFLSGLVAKKVDLESPGAVDDAAASLFGLGRAKTSLFSIRAGHLNEAVANLRLAFDYYVGVGDHPRAVAIAQHPVRAPVGERAGMADLLGSALEIVAPGSAEEGLLLALYGRVKGLEDGDYHAAETAFQASLVISSRLGDLSLEKRTLAEAAQVDLYHLHFQDARLKAGRAIQISAPENDLLFECVARFVAWAAGAWDCGVESNQADAEAFLATAEKLRDQFWVFLASWTFEMSANLRGDWDGARRYNEKEIPPLLGSRILTELESGNPERSEEHLQLMAGFLMSNPTVPNWINSFGSLALGIASLLKSEPQMPDLVKRAAEIVTSSPNATPVFIGFAVLGQAGVAIAEGNPLACSNYYQAALPFSGLCLSTVMCDRVLGLLSCVAGDLDQSAKHFEDALRLSGRAGYWPEYAWSCHGYADTLRQRNHRGDLDRATALLEEALSISRKLGMGPLADRIISLQEHVGPRSIPAPAHPDGLTAREVEVLGLVAAGKTDREIGAALVISVRTVTTHVSNILNKTNTANRTEAATYAARNGIVADEATS